MRVTVLLYSLLGFAAMCAGTPLAADLAPGPSTTTSQKIQNPTRSHISTAALVRRQEVAPELSKQFRQGIREEAETKEMDLIQWATDATTECLIAMEGQKQASNDAGIAICYNVPALFVTKALFAIDLRLFRINAPKGDWANLADGYSLGVSFGNNTMAEPRNATAPEISAAKAAQSIDSEITLLEFEPFIGKLSPKFVASDPSEDELKKNLMPTVTLMATTTDGKALEQPIVITDTSFILGVFSPPRPAPTMPAPVPFVLPGQQIEITPVGLYVFVSYMFVACGIYGWGTFERAKFRDQYRKKMAKQGPQ